MQWKVISSHLLWKKKKDNVRMRKLGCIRNKKIFSDNWYIVLSKSHYQLEVNPLPFLYGYKKHRQDVYLCKCK